MIRKENGFFHIATEHSSYLMRVLDTGVLDHVFYGERLYSLHGADNISEPFSLNITNVPYIDEEHPHYFPARFLSEYSTSGSGDSRESALIVDYGKGESSLSLLFDSYRIFKGKDNSFIAHAESDESVETLEIMLCDSFLPIKVSLFYTVYEKEDVILRSAKIVNETDGAIKLKTVSSLCLDFPHDDFSLISFDGAWARERGENMRKLYPGITVIDSKLGTSSNEHSPLVFLKRESSGEVFGFNLIYSGNHRELVEISPFGKTRVLTGINPYSFEWVLESSSSFSTPEAVMTYATDIDEASINFHRFVDNYIVRGYWKNRERPVLINSWEASYFDFDEEKLLSLAKTASELGFELFVLDDGWFSSRRDDTKGLGDWYVCKGIFPSGLEGFSSKIKDMGLMFGIWVEPEMVNLDSELYREHPDWMVSVPGRAPLVSRHQFLLDITRKEVSDYLYFALEKVFQDGNVDYVKWDFNRTITDCYSLNPDLRSMGEFLHRYVLALYGLLSRLTKRFPHILFEGCASGGNRFDLGILSFMPQIWTSDNTDLYHRIKIDGGTLRGFPLSSIGSHVSASPGHQSLRHSLIESRFDVSAFGVLGYELDLNKLNDFEKDAVKAEIEFYKRYRRVFQYGTFRPLRLSNPCSLWWSVALDDVTIVLEFVYRNMPNMGRCDRLRIPFLDKSKCYKISNRRIKIPKEFFGTLYKDYGKEESEDYSVTASGSILVSSGIALGPGFMGNGFTTETRVIGDNGTRMYVIEEVK